MEMEQNKTAIVIGASMAGLLTARVLSKHFEKVYVVERDALHDQPELRKGQPQTAHPHVLLSKGLHILQHYFPDLLDTFREAGVAIVDPTQTMRWYYYGSYRAKFDWGMDSIHTSRPFLEWQIRQRVLRRANVAGMESVLPRMRLVFWRLPKVCPRLIYTT